MCVCVLGQDESNQWTYLAQPAIDWKLKIENHRNSNSLKEAKKRKAKTFIPLLSLSNKSVERATREKATRERAIRERATYKRAYQPCARAKPVWPPDRPPQMWTGMLLFCSLLPLTIGLTLGQQPKQSPFANYSPRRAFEQAIFEPATVFESSIGDNQFLNGQQYQYFHAFQSSIIEPRSSEDSSSIVQPAAGEKLEQPLVQYNTAGTGHHGSSSYTQLHHQQPVASHQTSHQASHQSNSQASHQASHQTSHQTSHQASHQTNHQSNPQVNHQISHQANHQANHQVNHPTAHQASQQFDRFHHYDLEPTVYHANNPHPSNPQANNLQSLPSARHQQSAVYSTTPVPILRLKNTKIDGKLSPTLIITLPKKRKSNGKTRRFPFLKAIVSSFISTDRRTSEQNKNHQQQQSFKSSQQQQIQAANSVSSKLELPNNPNEYAASAHAARPKQQQQQNQHQHLAAGSTGNAQVAQLRSQTSMADANSNGNTNANMANGNVNSNGNSNTNSNANMVNSSPAQADNPSNSGNSNNNNPSAAGQNPNSNLNSNLNQNSNPNSNQNLNQNLNPTANQNANNANLPKEDAGKLMDAPFEPDAFPAKDELEDEDEDEFNEWSDAPRPHNFDDNSYYIESNKIKYSSVGGQEPIKQPLGDHQSSQSSYASVSQQGNIPQKKPAVVSSSSSSSSSYNANQYTSTSSPPDFESTPTLTRTACLPVYLLLIALFPVSLSRYDLWSDRPRRERQLRKAAIDQRSIERLISDQRA